YSVNSVRSIPPCDLSAEPFNSIRPLQHPELLPILRAMPARREQKVTMPQRLSFQKHLSHIVARKQIRSPSRSLAIRQGVQVFGASGVQVFSRSGDNPAHVFRLATPNTFNIEIR